MTEKKITSHNGTNDKELIHLYQTAFPSAEQISWKELMRLTDEMPLDFTAYYDGDEFVGFTIVYSHKWYNWFWYFAVNEKLRGQGYGQRILSQLLERYNDRTIILDMEAPDQIDAANKEQRHHRLGFYTRNGFRDTHTHRRYEGVEYTIMMIGDGDFTDNDYDEIIADMMSFWK